MAIAIDPTKIQEQMALAEKNFNRIQGEIRQIEGQEQAFAQKKAELNVELFRYQGESRALKALLEQKEPYQGDPAKAPGVPEAKE